MKYLFTTANKAFVLCLCLFCLIGETEAQKNTDSPYSRYGGIINPQRFNGNFGLGGVGYAWRPYHYKPIVYDSLARSNAKLNDRGTNYVNPANPASFSNISLTTFEAAILSKNTDYTSAGQNRVGSNTQLSHMTVAFPMGQNAGLGFGIRPFSSVGYNYEFSAVVNGEQVTNSYEGSGGINEIFVGTAFQVFENFSIGVKAQYLFGNIIDDRRVVYGSNSTHFFNTYDQRDLQVRDLKFDFGLQYFKLIKEKNRLIVGLKLAPYNKFNAKRTQIIRSYQGRAGFEDFKDTSLFVDRTDNSIPFAPTYGVGFAYERINKWMMALDFTLMSWNDQNVQEAQFQTSSRINFGFEKYTDPAAFGSYLKQMGYRAGINYNSSLLTINNEDIEEFGISFGIALPMRKSFSTLNLGIELGRRGKDETELIQEEFFNLQFGVTINDKWFIKRKYD